MRIKKHHIHCVCAFTLQTWKNHTGFFKISSLHCTVLYCTRCNLRRVTSYRGRQLQWTAHQHHLHSHSIVAMMSATPILLRTQRVGFNHLSHYNILSTAIVFLPGFSLSGPSSLQWQCPPATPKTCLSSQSRSADLIRNVNSRYNLMQQRNSIAPGGWLTDLSSALLQQYYRRRILQNPNVPRKLLKAAIFEKIIFQLFKNFSKIIFYFLHPFSKKSWKINPWFSLGHNF